MSGHKKYLSVALLSAVLLPAMASAADAPATFTPEQEAKIGKIAADYLVAHPEVLLQASQKLQQIQAEQQAPLHPGQIEREQPDHERAGVADHGEGQQAAQILLHQGEQRAVPHAG